MHWATLPRTASLREQVCDNECLCSIAHERVDQAIVRNEDDIRVERGLPLWSRQLGLTGKADVVEFHNNVPYPVEYKLGKQRKWQYEAIQVCAQALCLEEMTGYAVPSGAIYYCSSRTRREIDFDMQLREKVVEVAEAVRALLTSMTLPPGVNDQRCEKCSLIESCMPAVIAKPGRWRAYKAALFIPEEESTQR